MANTVFENKVIEAKAKDFLDTQLDLSPFYTHDDSLTENSGMTKVVNVYTATGNAEDLAMGEGNTEEIAVAFTPQEHTVITTQAKFPIFDEEIMKDPFSLDVGLNKGIANIVNVLTSKFVAELVKATKTATYSTTLDYDTIVDATALFGENETGLYLLINSDLRAQLRKNLKESLQYSEDFARSGYIGSVNGIPVYVSNAVPTGTAFMATAEAVTVFTKKDVEIELKRDADTRKNDFFTRVVNTVALTDADKVVKITKTV